MEEMKPNPLFLLNLPVEITEEIFLYLALPERKNLRLTCKQLYELCNSDRFCRDEKIKWSKDLNDHVNSQSDLHRHGRSYYNLVINIEDFEKSSILPFFKKLGAKIRSLVIQNCVFPPDSFESIIMLCEGLCSLSLETSNISSDVLTLKPFSITHLNVTNLKITLPRDKQYDYIHRMFTIFPNVKQLHIKVPRLLHTEASVITGNIYRQIYNRRDWASETEEHKKSKFFGSLPDLEGLTADFDHEFSEMFGETENWYPCYSNLVSVNLRKLRVFRPPELIRLLTNARLKYLSIESVILILDKHSFEKLVVSQLNTLHLKDVEKILGLPTTFLYFPFEANKTVENLYLKTGRECSESTLTLFLKYFRGLVHLTINCVTDPILQCIFQCQENLRSLQLGECLHCSVNGFCGSEYCINNFQKLEHLRIENILPEVIKSDELKSAFSLLQLKYLHIRCFDRIYSDSKYPPSCASRKVQIPPTLYENLTELRALRLRDGAIPSYETLSSLFRRLKHLNYLRYDIPNSRELLYSQMVTDLFENSPNLQALRHEDTARRSRDRTDFMNIPYHVFISSVTLIKINCEFSITSGKHDGLTHTHYNKELDRMVVLREAGGGETFYSPKIGTSEIDWIEV